jgi:hypothetical protein
MKGKHHSAHHDIHAHVKHHSMKHHRSAHAKGGKVSEGVMAHDETPHEVYAGAGSDVVKEASKKKRGGKVAHHMKHVAMHGEHAKHRLDRPARKSGGRVGSEMAPFSAASKVKTPAGRDVDAGEC